MSLVRSALLLGSIGLVLLSCSEKGGTLEVDSQGPTVQVLYPPYQIGDEFTVSDSVDVYIGAIDNDAVREVSTWYSRPGETTRRPIATTSTVVSRAEIPDSVSQYFDIPASWNIYRTRWRTLNITSGIRPQLFATAEDPSGNSGFSDVVTVFVLNRGQELVPPIADFIVRPPEGEVTIDFTFDAIGPDPDNPLTHDRIDLPSSIQVRWDFNGDFIWDVDWDAEATADQLQIYHYQGPGQYGARLQARNTYVEDLSIIKTVIVTVKPEGGFVDPPASMDGQFVTLKSGRYPRGATDPRGADEDEFPAHQVNLPFDVKILQREVTNAEYVYYLDADSALVTRAGHVKPEVIFDANRIYNNAEGDSAWLYLTLDDSRIFYDLDQQEFRVEPGYDDHPVMGVTWRGARAFAVRYGLRLLTEAEWEAAARGSHPDYRYSFGPEITSGDPTGKKRVNYVGSGDPFEGDRGTTPVMYYDGFPNSEGYETIDTHSDLDGGIGCYDMSGNLAEWCEDWYGLYPTEPIQTNPQGPLDGAFKVVRGGSYLSTALGVRVTSREADHLPDVS
ncbi:MAG: formylglycine-generating enzyme family protein, partial [Candidatus Eisenbacteria bacterium]|nr:formylglycine-generating enzyme family protein [Candidatus Eisenbacteria bacterium]